MRVTIATESPAQQVTIMFSVTLHRLAHMQRQEWVPPEETPPVTPPAELPTESPQEVPPSPEELPPEPNEIPKPAPAEE